ncbi:MAG TPA: type I 3-dehydroquinate dehydratase [Candidatus Polarisedimenticolaceae bacterium]|nr:type I 3-dehydroquinate dehydratase [Candidatus Polarisedimenticolaceae bacterium]
MSPNTVPQGPLVVGSLLASDVATAGAMLAGAPPGALLLELRADRLRADEVAAIVRRTERPLIVTVRRSADGGGFDGSEHERRALLTAALDAGARFVDVEWDRPLAALADDPSLTERVILSHHGVACRVRALERVGRAMRARDAAAYKIVASAAEVDELPAIRALLARRPLAGRPLAAFADGRAGVLSRLLAPSWGSWATYAALDRPTAEGQFGVGEMLDGYDVLAISDRTRRYALVGSTVSNSPSPAMHNAALRQLGLDARYFAVTTDRFGAFVRLARSPAAALAGFGVTMPFKEIAARRSRPADSIARASGAVNTVVVGPGGWVGYNTDGPAALASIGERIDPAGCRVAVLGAGGTGRAIACSLAAAGARVRLFNRSAERARRAARALGVEWAPEERLDEWRWDVLVHATPRGAGGERFIAPERLRGAVVLDAVYRPRETMLCADARRAGLQVIDGRRLLLEQALLQFRLLTTHDARVETLRAAAVAWLGSGW